MNSTVKLVALSQHAAHSMGGGAVNAGGVKQPSKMSAVRAGAGDASSSVVGAK